MADQRLRAILSANMKKLRNRREWAQSDLAEQANISTNYVSDIERGNKWPYPETLQNLADALGVAVYELFRPEDGAGPDMGDYMNRFSDDVLIAVQESVRRSLQNVKGQYGL